MIQRIQTVYLLLVAVLTLLPVFLPVAWFGSAEGQFSLYAFSLQDAAGAGVHSTIYMGIVFVAALVLPLGNIFLFRRRLLQIRLCVVEMVLLLGCVAMELAYYFLAHKAFPVEELQSSGMNALLFLPLVSMLLCFLAARAIFRDEMLVRSTDRIR